MTERATEVQRRRIPIISVSGKSDDETAKLRLLVYLVEIERQAEIFCRCFADSLAAHDDGSVDDVWRHLQGAMFAAIIVNRLVTAPESPRPWPWMAKADGRQAADQAASSRATRLRELLGLPDDESVTQIFGVRDVRDSLEHVDERLDRAMNSPGVHSVADWYLSDGDFLTSPETDPTSQKVGLRAFYPEVGLLLFDRDPLDLFALDLDMIRLRGNARAAQRELLEELRGRVGFGGGQLTRAGISDDGEHRQQWETKRGALLHDIEPPADLGTVRMWMQAEDSSEEPISTTSPDSESRITNPHG